MSISHSIFEEIISLENLFLSWQEFKRGKSKRQDTKIFESQLEDNLFQLHDDLVNNTYQHDSYECFHICDPKPRIIHKATVRDRIVHHAIFRILYPLFDDIFIDDSYSCRLNKGTHKAVERLNQFAKQVSYNHELPCWSLKMDVKKFFASVDHKILKNLISWRVDDDRVINLVNKIIDSFATPGSRERERESYGTAYRQPYFPTFC